MCKYLGTYFVKSVYYYAFLWGFVMYIWQNKLFLPNGLHITGKIEKPLKAKKVHSGYAFRGKLNNIKK